MSGGNGFDPSREWLGVAATDLADPFRALGLADDAVEADVTAAAERMLTRLQGIDPGPFHLAHAALGRRIEACRMEALVAIAARPRPAPVLGGPPPVPASPLPASPLPVPSLDEHVPDRHPPPRRRANSGYGAALVSLGILIATGSFAYLFWPGSGPLAKETQRQLAMLRRPAEPQGPAAVELPTVPQAPPGADPPRPLGPPATVPRPGWPATTRPSPPPPTAADPANPLQPPAPAPQQPPSPAEPIRLVAAVEQALRETLAALRRREFDTADARVKAAAALAAEDDALAARVVCWRQLTLYARQFDGYRRQALAVAAGDLDVGDRRISIVESSDTIFTFKAAGTMYRLSPAEVPAPIANAVVRTWFAAKDQPGNHVFLGTHLLTLDPPDLAAARREWEVAARGGENVTHLMPLLTDPIIRGGR